MNNQTRNEIIEQARALQDKNDTAYVKARNELEQWCNTAIPQVLAELNKGYALNQAKTQLFKKDTNRIKPIITTDRDKTRISAYLDVSEYSIYLKVRTHAPVDRNDKNGVFGSHYIEESIYLATPNNRERTANFTPFKRVTVKQIQSARAKLQQLKDKANAVQAEIYKTKRFLGL